MSWYWWPPKIDWMLTSLVVGLALLVYSFWHAQRKPDFDFNAFDLIMENGKVSKIAFTFMVAFAITSWVLVDLQTKDKMSVEYLLAYGGMWVAPLVTKLVANKQGPTVTDSDTAKGGA